MYKNVIARITGTCWAILPEKMSEIMAFLDSKINATITAADIEAAINRRATKFKNVRGDVAVIPLYGVMSQKINMMSEFSGGTSTEMFGAAFDEAISNPSYGAVVIDVDSPGGSVYGTTELSKKIYEARGKKPIIAVVNSLMASAATWVASAADEIVITPGGEAGSIGVLAVHVDQSQAEEKIGLKTTIIRAGKYKAEGNPHEPLSSEAIESMQSSVDAYYEMFTADVARNRGTTVGKVKSDFGQGRVMGAQACIQCGLVDRIATLEQVLNDIRPQGPSKAKRKAQS